jgi:DNA-binding NarL/FixJ family response regulator
VLLADDHAELLSALEGILEPSCLVVGRARDGAAIIQAATQLKPDVVVLDLALPEINGLDACHQIKQATPKTKVIILSAFDDAEITKRALKLGASAFVPKYAIADDLLIAIKKALLDET